MQEIATGKAYQRSKQAVVEASERLQVMAEPHVSKARVVVEPMLSAVIDKLEPTWQSIQKQLQKDQYRKINEAVSKLKDAVNGAWKRASQLVADVYDSDVVSYQFQHTMSISTVASSTSGVLMFGPCLTSVRYRSSKPEMTSPRCTRFCWARMFPAQVLTRQSLI